MSFPNNEAFGFVLGSHSTVVSIDFKGINVRQNVNGENIVDVCTHT
jgi:hypothetical protein